MLEAEAGSNGVRLVSTPEAIITRFRTEAPGGGAGAAADVAVRPALPG